MTTSMEPKKIKKEKLLPDHKTDIAAKAFLMNGHMSPRKVSLMTDEIREKTVANARKILSYSKKKSSELLLKLLNSAASNAINNNHYNKDDAEQLIIAHIWVGKGMMLKRIEPRARGSSNRIFKRYVNIFLYLKEKTFMMDKKNPPTKSNEVK